jgi:thioredoxin reductase (NADPH)
MLFNEQNSPSGKARALALLLVVAGTLTAGAGYKLFRSWHAKKATSDFAKNTFPCVIIGSGVGGLSSAVYLPQLGCKTLLFRGKNPGGALTKTQAVQNWPGEQEISGQALVSKIQQHAESFGAIISDKSVVSVNFSTWPFVISLEANDQGKEQKIYALSCIVATGATPNLLGVPGEAEFWGRGVTNCAICDGPMFKDETVAVVGGGDAALTEVELLSPLVNKIYLLVRAAKLRSQGPRVAKLLNNPKVEILYETAVQKVLGNEAGVTGVTTKTAHGREANLPVNGLFLAIGSKPNTALFKGQLELDDRNLIKLRSAQATSVKGVFAVGDVCDGEYRQAISAAGSGCIAALQALKFLSEQGVDLAAFKYPVPAVSAIVKGDQTSVPAAKKNVVKIVASEPVFELESEAPDELVLEAGSSGATNAQALLLEVESARQLGKIIEESKLPLILDIYAPWCMPCQLMQPIFEQLAVEFKGKINFGKANADTCSAMLQGYQVRGVPTFILFDKEGKEVERRTGQMDKQDFLELLSKLVP